MNQIKDISAFFSSRRSISVKNLNYPGPNHNQTMAILKTLLEFLIMVNLSLGE